MNLTSAPKDENPEFQEEGGSKVSCLPQETRDGDPEVFNRSGGATSPSKSDETSLPTYRREEQRYRVENIVVSPRGSEGGKTLFALQVELERERNPSTPEGGTEIISGFVLVAEEKDVLPLLRLCGRELLFLLFRSPEFLLSDKRETEIQQLREERDQLQEKCRTLSENLHLISEGIRRNF